MSADERLSRRTFLHAAGASATLAAAGTIVAGTMMVTETTARAATIGPNVVVSPGSPLIIDNSVHLQHVRLRGGQIVIHGGDVITIDRLTSE